MVGDQNNWVKIKASGRVSFAINSDGEMYAWGRNQYGQLGVGDFSNKQNPTLVQSSTPSLTIDWSGNGENLGVMISKLLGIIMETRMDGVIKSLVNSEL